MKRISALLALAPLFCPGAEHSIELTPAHTKVEWTLGSTLHTVHGTFRLTRGAITWDTGTGKASGEVVVDVKSGESGNGDRDAKMHKVVLESAKYPEAIFIPDRFDGASLHGTLKLHGADHEIVADVQPDGAVRFEIPFVKWGMKDPGNFLLKVDKVVRLTIETKDPRR